MERYKQQHKVVLASTTIGNNICHIHNMMNKNIFPYTLWCIKICRENIFFRLEEAHSVWAKACLSLKIKYPVIEKPFTTKYFCYFLEYIFVIYTNTTRSYKSNLQFS